MIVLTPKVKPADWRGAPVVSLDDGGSYAPLARAVAALEAERCRRLVLVRQGHAPEPLTVVLDEVPDLVDEVPGTGDLIRKIGQMGRDLRVRMILCTSSARVRDLGMVGRGAARSNFGQVRLSPAVADRPREGLLAWGEEETPLDLKLVPRLAQQADLGPRGWAPPRTVLRDEVADLPPAAGKSAENFQPVSGSVSARESAETSFPTGADPRWKLLIAAGIGAGKGKTEILRGLPGYSGRRHTEAGAVYDEVMRELGLVLEGQAAAG